MSPPGIDLASLKVVVFDLDGTLYDAGRLRRRMASSLGLHCLRHPRDLAVPRVLIEFRRCRERLAEQEREGIRTLQYTVPAARLGLDPERVRQVVEEWFFRRPLPYLQGCRFAGVRSLFAKLREMGKAVAVLSDYPVDEKLAAVGLTADLTVSAMDSEVDRLKPHPAGLARVLELAGAEPRECLVVGDREERDGACARRLETACLIKTSLPGGGPGTFHHYREFLSALESVGAATRSESAPEA
jgi:FMN phosphatase YigB (HAD superfamily)